MVRLFLTSLLLIAPGCASTPPGKPIRELAPEINATAPAEDTVIVPGDVLAVQFTRLPAWSQADLVVRSDGRVAFQALDDVHVSGLTVAQLDDRLTEEYTKILAQPDLTVRVTQLAPRNVFVLGEVIEGGAFPIPPGRLSLIEALGLAQGHIRDTALLEQVQLVRWDPEDNRVKTWKIDASREEWGSPESILIQPHDVIFVPAKPIVHVNDWVDRYIRRMIPVPYLSFIQ